MALTYGKFVHFLMICLFESGWMRCTSFQCSRSASFPAPSPPGVRGPPGRGGRQGTQVRADTVSGLSRHGGGTGGNRSGTAAGLIFTAPMFEGAFPSEALTLATSRFSRAHTGMGSCPADTASHVPQRRCSQGRGREGLERSPALPEPRPGPPPRREDARPSSFLAESASQRASSAPYRAWNDPLTHRKAARSGCGIWPDQRFKSS